MANMPDLRQDFSFQHFRPADDKSATILHEAWSNMARNALDQMQHKDSMDLENKKIANMKEQTKIDGQRLKIAQDKYQDQKDEDERLRRQTSLDLNLDNKLASQLFFYGDELDKNTKGEKLFTLDDDKNLKFTDNSGIIDKINSINTFNVQGNYKEYVEEMKSGGGIPMSFPAYATKVQQISQMAASDNITTMTQEFITDLKNSNPEFADMSDAKLEEQLNKMLNSNSEFSNALESYWLGEIGTNLESYDDQNWYMDTYNKQFAGKGEDISLSTPITSSDTIEKKRDYFSEFTANDAKNNTSDAFWTMGRETIRIEQRNGAHYAHITLTGPDSNHEDMKVLYDTNKRPYFRTKYYKSQFGGEAQKVYLDDTWKEEGFNSVKEYIDHKYSEAGYW